MQLITFILLAYLSTVALATSQVGPVEPKTPDQRNFDESYHKPSPTFGYGPNDDDSSKPLS